MYSEYPLISIIIPAFNEWAMTKACLESLRNKRSACPMEIIVVDNGSTDATPAELPELGRSLFSRSFRLIRLDANRNFGPASNIGAAMARGDYLFFLNNDTEVTDNWDGPLIQAFRNTPKLGGAGSLLLFPGTERVQHAGITFSPTMRTEHLYANFPATHPAILHKRSLQAITGAAMMIPRHLFRDFGPFFPGYVNGCEDLDLCCAIRRGGYSLTCVPESRILHHESATPGRFDKDSENSQLLARRCAGCFEPDFHLFAREDGFAVGLTTHLESFLKLPDQRTDELDAVLEEGFDAKLWWEILMREPLWERGYEELATAMESRGKHGEASFVRSLQVFFFPRRVNAAQLLRTAARADQKELVEQASSKLSSIEDLLKQPRFLVRTAVALSRWSMENDAPEMHAIYDDWLIQNAPGYEKFAGNA